MRSLVDDVSLPVSAGSLFFCHVYLTTAETHQGLEFIACMTRKYILPQLDETRILAEAAEDIYDVNVQCVTTGALRRGVVR